MGRIVALAAAWITLAVLAPSALASNPARLARSGGAGGVAAWLGAHAAWAMPLLAAAALAWFVLGAKALRPGGLDVGGTRKVQRVPLVLWVFAALVVLLTQSLAATLAQGWLGITDLEKTLGGVRAESVLVGAAGVIGAVVAVGMAWLLARGGEGTGLRLRVQDLGVGAGLFLLVFPIVTTVGLGATWLATRINGDPGARIAHGTLAEIAQHRSSPWAWGLVAAVVVAVPVLEELLYRGMIQSAVRRVTGGPWAAVLVTSAGFTAMHWSAIPDGSKHQLALLFTLSVALGAAFERTRSIGVPIVMHALFNGVNVALAVSG